MGAAFPSPPVQCHVSPSRPTHFSPIPEHGDQCTKGAVNTFHRLVDLKDWVSIRAHSAKAAKREISRRSQAPTNLKLKSCRFCLNHRQSTKYLSIGVSFFQVLTLVPVTSTEQLVAVLFLRALQLRHLSLTNGLELARGDRADSVSSPLASLAIVSENKGRWQDIPFLTALLLNLLSLGKQLSST